MGKRHEYIGVVEKGMSMTFRGEFINTIYAAVKFTGDGRIVQTGMRYHQGSEPKGLQARATAMAAKWQAYFKRTGKRFELEQDAKKKAKLDKLKAKTAAKRKVMEAGPALRVALHSLVHAVRFDGNVEEAMRQADELLVELPK